MMKITVSQLRKIIREEVQKNLTEAKLKVGDIYKNKAGHQISVEFLDGGDAGWELLARGKSKSLDGTAEELQAALTAGGFEFDRNENVY